jgi:hypothetical protein
VSLGGRNASRFRDMESLATYLLISNLKTRRIVGSPVGAAARLGVALWNGLECDARAEMRPQWRLPIA